MTSKKLETATFGAGCFWGVEETFRTLKGVKGTAVGFMGGHTEIPSYKDVCNKDTGHAEVVHITFKPSEISYEMLLNVFWENHDPTQYHRQGPDGGSQYRSVIFYHNPKQKKIAEQSKKFWSNSGKFEKPIVTEIIKAGEFYKAEDYHQKYLMKRGESSCHA
ncbi:MAG: peptide-methionine (S)-S-oxide reductase MsrA [Nanoarchaeota archaeon]